MQVEAAPDGLLNIFAIVAFVFSFASLGVVFWAYKTATALPQ